MPVITFAYSALEAALARGARRSAPSRAAVLSALRDFGCAVEGPEDLEALAVEALMNRPDLFAVEGIARAMRSFLALSPSPAYAVAKGPVVLLVDPAVHAVRPEIASAVVRGVDLDEPRLRRLLDAQEKLDLTYGRRRTRVSIGLHNLAPLAPPITYTAVAPTSTSFVPLFADQLIGGPRALSLQEILEVHPKGIEYAPLLAGQPRYPLLVDSKGGVLSMPPIINGALTELKPGTHDLFLDVTGTARAPVAAAARLLAMQLAEAGGTLESVEIRRPGEPPAFEPDLAATAHRVAVASASSLIGATLRADEVAAALERMGHGASVVPGGAQVDALVPPWRFDILHEADLIEDVAIGLGYRNVPGHLPRLPTVGEEEGAASVKRRARASMTGLGFLEVMTLTLTSPDAEGFGAAPQGAEAAQVENPLTREHSALRSSLVPSLLGVLGANTSRDLPQGIFEVGDVVEGGRNAARLAAAYVGSDASFTRAKGIAASLMGALGLALDLEGGDAPAFVRGRCAHALVAGKSAGTFGEVSPAVLGRFALTHPAIALEFALEPLRARPA